MDPAEQDRMSPESTRRHLRSILLQVHPDHFSSHKDQQHSNSEALKLLNAYLDRVAEGKRVDAFTLRFFIKGEPAGTAGSFKAVAMPGNGSLAPLFHAFGLISDADLRKAESDADDRQKQHITRDLLAWLLKHMGQITRTQHEFAKQEEELGALHTTIKQRFKLDFLAVDCCLDDMALSELQVLQRQVVRLKALDSSLLRLEGAGHETFEGLNIWLKDRSDWVFAGGQRVHMDPINGTIYLVAGSNTLDQELASLDPSQARSLKMASETFNRMLKGLLAEAASLLGVSGVDVSLFGETITPGHRSLTWVQRLLNDDRQMVQEAMSSCSTQHLSFITIVIESEEHRRPMVDPDVPTWLRVSNNSSPKDLVDFLCSAAGGTAAAGAHASRLSDKAKKELLERVAQALGCRSVWTAIVISAEHGRIWHDAALRLLDHAQLLRSSVDLSSIILCLGDKYEIRAERGIVTIPCNFDLEDLSRQLRLLMAPQPPAPPREPPSPMAPQPPASQSAPPREPPSLHRQSSQAATSKPGPKEGIFTGIVILWPLAGVILYLALTRWRAHQR